MRPRTLAHVSDLHVGHSAEHDRATAALCYALVNTDVDHVLITGDVTHRGRRSEMARFRALFAPLFDVGRATVLPGNHDRVGEDAGAALMNGERVRVTRSEGLYIVAVDSTGPHNRSYFASHGDLCHRVLDQIDAALDQAPAHVLTVVALHHHPLPLPEEGFAERFASRMGWPNASELQLGPELLQRALGRCDLVLHGHRHIPREFELLAHHGRHLGIYNAGSSSELSRVRVFTHCLGALLEAPRWLSAEARVRIAPRDQGAPHSVWSTFKRLRVHREPAVAALD